MPDHDGQAHDGKGRYVRTLTGARKDAAAADLRSKGWTYQRIADELGFTEKGEAHHAVDRCLKATVKDAGEAARTMERERLDRLSEAAWAVLERRHVTVSNGKVISLPDPDTGEIKPLEDDAPVLQAIDRLLRISESRRKLDGLDAPSRVSLDAQLLGAEIDALLRQAGSDDGTDG